VTLWLLTAVITTGPTVVGALAPREFSAVTVQE
jgi:hypothetical protein